MASLAGVLFWAKCEGVLDGFMADKEFTENSQDRPYQDQRPLYENREEDRPYGEQMVKQSVLSVFAVEEKEALAPKKKASL